MTERANGKRMEGPALRGGDAQAFLQAHPDFKPFTVSELSVRNFAGGVLVSATVDRFGNLTSLATPGKRDALADVCSTTLEKVLQGSTPEVKGTRITTGTVMVKDGMVEAQLQLARNGDAWSSVVTKPHTAEDPNGYEAFTQAAVEGFLYACAKGRGLENQAEGNEVLPAIMFSYMNK